jgi:multidrug efflux pump subunit AcrA (membrane-fusion protein)
MKGILTVTLVLAACALILFASGCAGPTAVASAPPAAPQVQVQTVKSLTVEGKLVPQQAVVLSLPAGGAITEVLVHEGDRVAAGQVLLRLNKDQQAAALAQAEAVLERARAQLDALKAGARAEEIAAAEAAVDVARAQVERLSQPARPEDVAAAKAALAGAQAERKRALEGPGPERAGCSPGGTGQCRGRCPPGAGGVRSGRGGGGCGGPP